MGRNAIIIVAGICAFLGYAAFVHPVPGAWPIAVVASVAFAWPALASVRSMVGRRAWSCLAGLAFLAYAVESLGVMTGFPYGAFRYAQGLGPLLFGLVPLTLPFSWIPILIGADALSHKRAVPTAWRLPIGMLVAVVADLVIDPGAVALGYWRWASPGGYFGIPWGNFLGWALTACVGLVVLRAFVPAKREWPPLAKASLLWNVAFFSGTCLAAGLGVPAAIGLFLMACLVV